MLPGSSAKTLAVWVSAESVHTPESLPRVTTNESVFPSGDHDRVRLIAAAIAKLIVDRRPDIATIERMIRDRNGKVYVDFGQNGRGRTMASVYSPRARPRAPVATPLRWEELNGPIDPEAFTIRTIFKRLERMDDLFATMSKDPQDIGPFCEALHA